MKREMNGGRGDLRSSIRRKPRFPPEGSCGTRSQHLRRSSAVGACDGCLFNGSADAGVLLRPVPPYWHVQLSLSDSLSLPLDLFGRSGHNLFGMHISYYRFNTDWSIRMLKINTVHLRMLMHFAMLTYLVCSRCLGRSGYLLILRFTPREFHRLRLDTTRSSRISSRIAWCKFFLA